MRCSRCGASAVVTRGEDYFCGRCALAYDWEEIIAIAQEVAGAPLRQPARAGLLERERVSAPV